MAINRLVPFYIVMRNHLIKQRGFMKKLIACLNLILLAGCSAQKLFDRNDPIDNALKACGLGYSTEAGGIFRAAYRYAEKEGGLDFEAKMAEGIETQVGAISKSDAFNKGTSSSDKIDLIKSTQNCVIKYTETYKPKTQNDLINECMADLQQRSAGIGTMRTVITVKNWTIHKNHPKYSEENPVVYAQIDKHSTLNPITEVMVQCKSINYTYNGLEPVEYK